MRVLYILPYVPVLVRVRPYNLLLQLAQRHDVSVLAVGRATEAEAASGLLERCRRVEIVGPSWPTAIRSCLAGALAGRPLQASVCHSNDFDRRLTGLLESDEFDVVHIEHIRAAGALRLIPPAIPTVYDSVDCISLLLERTRLRSHSVRRRFLSAIELARTRRYEAYLLRRFDRTIVTAPEDRRALEALAPGAEVTVVPNGVDLDRFYPLTDPSEPATLVFSGKMSYHANVSAVLYFVQQILPRIRLARPDVRLRVVGSSPVAEIRALARDPAITVTGAVPDMRDAMGGSTVAVCPMTVKVGIQNKVLEAMALGIPVVSSREGLEGLGAEPGRDLLVAGDAGAFGDHVCRLLADAVCRRQLAAAGLNYVRSNHRWESATRQIELVYRDVITRHTVVPVAI